MNSEHFLGQPGKSVDLQNVKKGGYFFAFADFQFYGLLP